MVYYLEHKQMLRSSPKLRHQLQKATIFQDYEQQGPGTMGLWENLRIEARH